jgi:predicted GIY-YIG superfamily endonuclease
MDFLKNIFLTKFIYFENFELVHDAIYREKQLKHWNRSYKENLIKKKNPLWRDLYEDIFGALDEDYNQNILTYYLERKNK